ncbi:class IV adenylate cyclase [Maritalea sp.]|uniref:class IV adenylate cyclase n=1 Tax=Maritalea sp. TaxID=2003361 RepID=UPI003EF94A89
MKLDTGEHFIGRFEVEQKFKCDDLQVIGQRLKALGSQPFMQGGSETDIYLDLPDNSLSSNNQALVVREMVPSNRVLIISKGPGVDECRSVETKGFVEVCQMFFGLGYQQTRCIKKARDVHFLGKCHVTLDKLDGFGAFVEVAIMVEEEHQLLEAKRLVDEAVQLLGLSLTNLETRSYAQIIDAAAKA